MEGRKQVGSSSFPSDLFGVKDSSSSSSGIFGSVFPSTSTAIGRDISHSELIGSLRNQDKANPVCNTKQGVAEKKAQYSEGNNHGTVEPCFLSSSLYYGGQDVYSQSPNIRSSGSYPIFKKDGGEDDPNGSSLNSASRGNWWQGSLYY
ncbi:PREDICTED: uncharacterized protein LOC104601144 [Nelumbo nucifera]|uniref:Uncharacterized protein LOC104601144 n=1 Tax=Nelumbo nucifera TaxID=4432 RepID=A0A1U8A623_NELNU|nr:PREDICTED: uncharacterized protein LOC104601144 [Nelumbo nucifera]